MSVPHSACSAHRGWKRGVTNCVSCRVDAGSRTQVLYKSKHSSPLSQHCTPLHPVVSETIRNGSLGLTGLNVSSH